MGSTTAGVGAVCCVPWPGRAGGAVELGVLRTHATQAMQPTQGTPMTIANRTATSHTVEEFPRRTG